jgi:hypothetical protein
MHLVQGGMSAQGLLFCIGIYCKAICSSSMSFVGIGCSLGWIGTYAASQVAHTSPVRCGHTVAAGSALRS